MDKPSQQEYITDVYDLGGYLGEIGRRVALMGETLRGIAKLTEEHDSAESGALLYVESVFMLS